MIYHLLKKKKKITFRNRAAARLSLSQVSALFMTSQGTWDRILWVSPIGVVDVVLSFSWPKTWAFWAAAQEQELWSSGSHRPQASAAHQVEPC